MAFWLAMIGDVCLRETIKVTASQGICASQTSAAIAKQLCLQGNNTSIAGGCATQVELVPNQHWYRRCSCLLENNKEECIVGMGNSTVNLVNCNMQSSGGPAIDMTGTSVLHVNQGSIQDCVGKTTKLYR